MGPHRICRRCDPPHAENCGICFGFGVRVVGRGEGSDLAPVSAGEVVTLRADARLGAAVLPCPECGGTLAGVGSGRC